jgi:hypothetical protein
LLGSLHAFARRGNVVQLAPSALNPENAEQTLAELDRLAAIGGSRKAAQPAPAGQPIIRKAGLPASVKYHSVHEAAQSLINDLGDDDIRSGTTAGQQHNQASSALPTRPQEGSSPQSAPASTEGLPVPVHSLAEQQEDSKGPARLELHVDLPHLEGIADVQVGSVGRACVHLLPRMMMFS